MRVRVIRQDTVKKFTAVHSNRRKHFDHWLFLVESADWKEPFDIVRTCNGNLLGSNRVIFDIGGNGRNAYRMICTYRFGVKLVHLYINWIGTHEKYNSLSLDQKMKIWSY